MTKFGIQELNRSLVGFDRLFQQAEARLQNITSYPPHNVIKLDEAGDNYVLEFAVAGFKRDDITLEVVDQTLIVRGQREQDMTGVTYIHHGLAKRSFVKQIALSDYVEVAAAKLENGILAVHLERRVPEAKKPKQIEIS